MAADSLNYMQIKVNSIIKQEWRDAEAIFLISKYGFRLFKWEIWPCYKYINKKDVSTLLVYFLLYIMIHYVDETLDNM